MGGLGAFLGAALIFGALIVVVLVVVCEEKVVGGVF
jgi:hypothetical protein